MAAKNFFNNDYFFYWRISDVHLCPKNFIHSPSFSIQPLSGVFWCLRVEIADTVDVHGFNCSLLRIPSEIGPQIIFVDYQLSIDGPVTTSKCQEFEKARFLNVVQPSTRVYAEITKESDNLYKDLLVTCKVLKCNFEKSFNTGFYYPNLSSLSENLLSGYLIRMFPDVILNVQELSFHTHRAIIHARLPILAKNLFSMTFETQSEIEVHNIKPNLINSLLCYAYSGFLTEECYSDSRELYYLAEQLQLTDLQQILKATSNMCVAKTTMNVEKKTLSWVFGYPLNWTLGVATDIAILSHTIGRAEIVTVGYRIFKHEEQEYFGVNFQFPKLFECCPIMMRCAVWVTREVQNQTQTILNVDLHHLFTSSDLWSPKPFLKKSDIDQSVSSFRFVFKIILCDGEYKSVIEESNSDVALTLPRSRDFEKLSFDMTNLLDPIKFSDIVLVTQTQLQIPAHKAILASRSYTFQSLIRQYTDHNNVLQVDGVSNNALLFIVHYIYSGKTINLRLSNALEFHAAAEYFQIHALYSETQSFIEQYRLSSVIPAIKPC